MSDPTIRAALDAAEREPTTASKIVAFLRALPDAHLTSVYYQPLELAAAVEEAARHD